MKRFRLLSRGIVVLVFLFCITAVATAALSASILERNLTEQYESKGTAIATGLAGASVEMLLFRDAATIQAMIEQYLEEGKIQGVAYIFVVDKRGNIICHTFSPGIPDEVRRLKGDRHETTVQQLRIQDRGDFIDIASPILAGNVGYVHVGMDRELIRHAITAAMVQQMALMGVLFLLSTVTAYWLFQSDLARQKTKSA